MKWYEFSQNNSGGRFHYDEVRGITERVWVEAENLDAAVSKAEDIGLYFNGVSSGVDCDCCGDRWYRPWRNEGVSIEDVVKESQPGSYSMYEHALHHADGHVSWLNEGKSDWKPKG